MMFAQASVKKVKGNVEGQTNETLSHKPAKKPPGLSWAVKILNEQDWLFHGNSYYCKLRNPSAASSCEKSLACNAASSC